MKNITMPQEKSSGTPLYYPLKKCLLLSV